MEVLIVIYCRNISKYLFLLLKALRKLDRYYPDAKRKYLYRCITINLSLSLNLYIFNF